MTDELAESGAGRPVGTAEKSGVSETESVESTTEAYVERMQLSPHERRSSLLSAERKLQVGRREESPGLLSEDAKAARMRIIIGLGLALVVVIAVIVLMVVLGRGM